MKVIPLSVWRIVLPRSTRWRLVTFFWIILAYFYFSRGSYHVLVTDLSSALNLTHCHINSLLVNPRNSGKSGVDFCCLNKTQLELRFTNIHLIPTYYHIYQSVPDVCFGTWQPVHCRSRQNVAILIPYRDREMHLRLLLARLHPLLQHQSIRYSIYVIEQAGNAPFNRGLLLNIGIREVLIRDSTVDCFVFHDVDLLPENSDNLYLCDNHLRHLAAGVDEFRYHVPFLNYAGGVSSLSRDNVIKSNGFPNRYWGWGNEDDELAARCYLHGIRLSRPKAAVGRYRAVRHLKATRGYGHYDSFRSFRAFLDDGLTALDNHSVSYQIIEDSTPKTKPYHVSQTQGFCNYSSLLNGLNISTTNWIRRLQSGTRVSSQWSDQWELVARRLLYVHMKVDTSAIYAKPPVPANNARESWYWFLHFYGWI